MSTRKIPIDDFCKQQNKTKRQVYRLFAQYPTLKAQVKGEKKCRVNLDKWDRILQTA